VRATIARGQEAKRRDGSRAREQEARGQEGEKAREARMQKGKRVREARSKRHEQGMPVRILLLYSSSDFTLGN
jgi:hypothetical protein